MEYKVISADNHIVEPRDLFITRMPAEYRERMAAQHPLGRLGIPADVASAALFLASDASAWLTGITIDVAGGRFMN